MANETDDWGKNDQPVTSDWGAGDLPDLPSKKYLPSTVSGALSEATKPITSIPAAYQEMIRSSVGQMGRGVEQLSGALEQPTISSKAWEAAKGVGNIALGGVGYVGAPLAAPLHTIVGEPVRENLEPVIGPQAAQVAGAMAEGLAGFALPTKVPQLRAAPKMPLEEPYGITRSLGERTGNIGMRAEEAGAMRTAKDPYAVEFAAQREAQIDAARENLIRGINPYEQQIIALTPREAGELVSRGVIGEATAARTNVNSLYRNARELPGEINAGAFKGIGQKIKGDVSLGDNPVIIDNTTPQAAKMINYLDDQISNLKIKNVPDPFGAPSAENIVGVNLNGVDQWRKNLSLMRRDAFASSPPGQINADARAAQAVLDAFDEKVINAINNPAIFTGNARAVDAWNQARQAYSDYKRTFTAQRNDPAGRAVQRIIGDPINDPLTPSKVIDSIVGPTGVTSTPTNIAVANRVRSVLGEYSPEWIGVKQGLLQRLIRPAEGEADFGIAKQAQNLSKFLNNDMARVVYTPAEQNVLRGYANLMRDLTLPPGTYAPSEPAIRRLQSALTQRVGGVIGSIIGSKVVPIPVLGEAVGYSVGKQIEKTIESSTNNLKKNFPIISQEMRKWSEAQSRAMAQPQNTMAQRAAVSAFVGLQNALTPLGIKLDELMQPRAIPQITIHKEPPRATGGSVFDKMHMARKRAEGGGTDVPFNEWDAVPRNAEGIPQIRIEKPPVNEADEAQAAREAAAARIAGNVRGAPYEPTPPSTEGKTWLMEPGKEAVQSGNYENTLPPNVRLNDAGIPYYVETGEELQMARRPNVLPLTGTPYGVKWAMPKAVELAGDIVNPLAVTKGVALNPGEFALGSGPIRNNGQVFKSAAEGGEHNVVARPNKRASAEDINRAADESAGMTQAELRALYNELGITGTPPSSLVKPALADQPKSAIDAATSMKLEDIAAMNKLSKKDRELFVKGKLPNFVLPSQEAAAPARTEFDKVRKEIKKAETEFDLLRATRDEPRLFDLSSEALNKVPNVDQFRLPRVEPKITERLQPAYAGGAGLKRLERAAEKASSADYGWYQLQQVRDTMHSIHGPKKGEMVWNAWLDSLAGTSMVNPISSNVRGSTYYLREAMSGRPLPQSIPVVDPKTGNVRWTLAGAPEAGYGAKAQIQHADRVREFMAHEGDPIANPKPMSYRQNLGGNWMPRTVDTHDIRNAVGMPHALTFGENAGLLPGEYAALEQLGEKAASRSGVPQAAQQAATWIGGGAYTKLKSIPIPLLNEINRRIHVTAKINGVTPDVLWRDVLRGKEILKFAGGSVFDKMKRASK